MRDIHDQAEAHALAWVREYKSTYPSESAEDAMRRLGARVRDAAAAGWDDVTVSVARKWLEARRAAEV